MISRTASMSQPYVLVPTRKSSVRAAASVSRIVVCEEPKILQRIGVSKICVRPRGTRERTREVRWKRGPQLDLFPRDGMPEAQPRRVQEVAFRRQHHEPPSPTAPIRVVA